MCVCMYRTDTVPLFPFVTVIRDMQYASSLREPGCFLVLVVFLGWWFSFAFPSRQQVYNVEVHATPVNIDAFVDSVYV